MRSLLSKFSAPALPDAAKEYKKPAQDAVLSALRLYFRQLDQAVNNLIGTHGGRFVDTPHALFWSAESQTIDVADVGQPVEFGQTYLSSAVTIEGTPKTRVTVRYNGVYTFHFSGNARSSTAAAKTVLVWMALNGTAVPFTARSFTLSGSAAEVESVHDYSLALSAGDYIEILFTSDKTEVSLEGVAATAVHPGIPSSIMIVNLASAAPNTVPTLPAP